MDMKDYLQKIQDNCDEMKGATPERKKELEEEFWTTAIKAFNEHIAGDFYTADGRLVKNPPIEL